MKWAWGYVPVDGCFLLGSVCHVRLPSPPKHSLNTSTTPFPPLTDTTTTTTMIIPISSFNSLSTTSVPTHSLSDNVPVSIPSDTPVARQTNLIQPPTEADFLADVSVLLETTSLSANDKLAAASRLVEARSRWAGIRAQADDAYWRERNVILTEIGLPQLSKSHQLTPELAAGGSASNPSAETGQCRPQSRKPPILTVSAHRWLRFLYFDSMAFSAHHPVYTLSW